MKRDTAKYASGLDSDIFDFDEFINSKPYQISIKSDNHSTLYLPRRYEKRLIEFLSAIKTEIETELEKL